MKAKQIKQTQHNSVCARRFLSFALQRSSVRPAMNVFKKIKVTTASAKAKVMKTAKATATKTKPLKATKTRKAKESKTPAMKAMKATMKAAKPKSTKTTKSKARETKPTNAMKTMKAKDSEQIGTDLDFGILVPWRAAFLRELYNSRRRLRQVMHPHGL